MAREEEYTDQEKELFKPVLDSINAGVIIIDGQGRVIYVNRTCEKLLEVSLARIKGKHYTEAFAKLPVEERFAILTLETGKEFKNVGYRKARHNKMYVITDTTLLKDAEGNTIGAAAVFKDVTVMYKLLSRLQETSKLSMLGKMAAGIANEVLNPLTTIKGFLQLVQQKAAQKKLEPEEAATYAGIVLKELDRLNQLLNEFLQLANFKPSVSVNDLNALLLSAVAQLKDRVREKKLQLVMELTEGIKIPGDGSALEQAFYNIIENAVDILKTGGRIDVRTGLENGWALVRIADDGPGMVPEVQENIFTPFFTTREEGTGLGLALVHQIIYSHQGAIDVQSGPGEGTEFIIKLPLEGNEG